jgi:hypothetical protein
MWLMLLKITLTICIMGLFGCSPKQKIKDLFSQSGSFKDKIYKQEQLENLPAPVQHYFKVALKDGQPYISQLRLKQSGTFKTAVNKEWMDIKGEQYFTAAPPGFVWFGKTRMFNAHDSYINDSGNLSVYLLGFIRIVNSSGNATNQAELLRWLGESVWMPTNLLPGKNINWSAIDDSTAKLIFTGDNLSVWYLVHFNKQGQITSMETERYMEENRLEKWTGNLSNYQDVNGVTIPLDIEARWNLAEGDHIYARFHVEDLQYNLPQKYE